MTQLLIILYTLTVSGLALYGLLGLLTLWLYWRHRHDTFPTPTTRAADLPPVTVQLPIYNERFVVKRLIEAAVSLDYPRHKLEIQILDDSTDDTTTRAADLAAHYQQQGINIHLVHRDNRVGYKAGALENGLHQATGDFIAIFDADFQPKPDYLRQTVPHFLEEPELGMIQARWGHLNDNESSFTTAQAIALDKHFAMEQTVRHRANLFPKFNGAGGIWRRTCLLDAGGWEDDTVCEDLCLSTRAILRGWRFRFLNDVVAPAELPTSMTAYKNQQARWAKGSFQCLGKFGRAILTDRSHSLLARWYALLSMSAYFTHVLVLILLLLQIPLLLSGVQFTAKMYVFSIAGIGQPILFVLAQQVLYRNWLRRLRHFPTLLLVAIGTAPSNGRALWQSVFGHTHVFIRTPKKGDTAVTYTLPFDRIIIVELLLALYAAVGLIIAIYQRNPGPLFFLTLCCAGFSYVALTSLRETWRQRRPAPIF